MRATAKVSARPTRIRHPKSPTQAKLVYGREPREGCGLAFLVSGRRFRLRSSYRFRCDFDRHSARSDDPLTVCIRPQTGVPIQVQLFWGRTGFDSSLEAQAACRGWFVGLVKIRTKKNKCRSPRSRSRGLIDCDVPGWTPATARDMDSRLIGRRSDRAGR